MTNSSNRTEFIAIPVVVVVLGILFALMLASDVGVWAWIVSMAALVVLGALAIGIIVRRHRHPAAFDAPATATSASTSDAYRILVIADESLTQRALEDEIAPHAGERAVEALVLAPALRSRLAHWTGDDSQQDEAEDISPTRWRRSRRRGFQHEGSSDRMTRSRRRTTACACSRPTRWSS